MITRTTFSKEDDARLKLLVSQYGDNAWNLLSIVMNKTKRQLKDRWCKYLDPKINNSPWSEEEDKLLIEKYKEIGNKWCILSKYFDRRTDNSIKNRWKYLVRNSQNAKTFTKKERTVKMVTFIDKSKVSKEQIESNTLDFELIDSGDDWTLLQDEYSTISQF